MVSAGVAVPKWAFSDIENPDGDYYGAGKVSESYGSTRVPSGIYDTADFGQQIPVGHEWSGLEEIAYNIQNGIDGPRYVCVNGVYVDTQAASNALDTAITTASTVNWERHDPEGGGGGNNDDGVEVAVNSQASFDWDDDGFRES